MNGEQQNGHHAHNRRVPGCGGSPGGGFRRGHGHARTQSGGEGVHGRRHGVGGGRIQRGRRREQAAAAVRPDPLHGDERHGLAGDAQARQAGRRPLELPWDTDYCTRLADKPGGFDFRLSCARHDFGYRNYKQLIGKKAFAGSTHERRVDKAFLFDMNRQCAAQPHKTKAERTKCRKKAKAYYERVS